MLSSSSTLLFCVKHLSMEKDIKTNSLQRLITLTYGKTDKRLKKLAKKIHQLLSQVGNKDENLYLLPTSY